MALAHPTLNKPRIDYSPSFRRVCMGRWICPSLIRLVALECLPYNPNTIPSTFFLCWPFAFSFQVKPIPWSTGLSAVAITRQLGRFQSSFFGLAIGSFPIFKGPPTSLTKTPLKSLVSCLFTFQKFQFNLSMGPSHSGIPENKHADSLPEARAFLPTAMVRPLSLSLVIAKPVTSSLTNGDVTFPHFPSHFNCAVPTVYPGELVL